VYVHRFDDMTVRQFVKRKYFINNNGQQQVHSCDDERVRGDGRREAFYEDKI